MKPIFRKFDLGRMIVIPIFAFVMTLHVYNLYQDLKTLFPTSWPKRIDFSHHLILLIFYGLIILLYFLRSPARSTSKSWVANAVAVATTFLPFLIPFLEGSTPSNRTVVFLANLIILVGVGLAVYSLNSLGRNLSIIPQARNLVHNGPYRFVRHPLYLSEGISLFGVVLANISATKIFILLTILLCQVYRAIQEERLLAGHFPEYRGYQSRTSRFIPGIF